MGREIPRYDSHLLSPKMVGSSPVNTDLVNVLRRQLCLRASSIVSCLGYPKLVELN